MSNDISTSAVSNCFEVKDQEAFIEWADSRDLVVGSPNSDSNLVWCVPREWNWEDCRKDSDSDDQCIYTILLKELAPMLKDHSIAVFTGTMTESGTLDKSIAITQAAVNSSGGIYGHTAEKFAREAEKQLQGTCLFGGVFPIAP